MAETNDQRGKSWRTTRAGEAAATVAAAPLPHTDGDSAPLRLRRRGPRRAGRPARPVARNALLAVAVEAFAERGFAGTRLETVAARTGLRRASLLHHFPSKEALYRAALETVIADLGGLVRDARLDQGDFVERLDRLGELIVRYLGRRPAAARLLLREAMDGAPFLREGGWHAMLLALHGAADFLAAGMGAGVFALQDARQLVLTIAGLHLCYFAVGDVADAFLEAEPSEAGVLERRVAAVLAHVRRLCLAERPDPSRSR